jgi:hypothetical protein
MAKNTGVCSGLNRGVRVRIQHYEYKLDRAEEFTRGLRAACELTNNCWSSFGAQRTATTCSICAFTSVNCARKLGDNQTIPKYIVNEPGIGYRLMTGQ